MDILIKNTIDKITASMRNTPLKTCLTPGIRNVCLKLVNSLDSATVKVKGGSKTQASSSRIENVVLGMLDVPVLDKVSAKKKTLFHLPAFVGDYYGFKRSVEHRNECRIDHLPEKDGVYAVYQPYGSQANPDILLLDIQDKKIVCQFGIEIKSGTSTTTWNTHIQFADRSMLYISFEKEIHYFFGDHVRNQESLILALAWDELQRELANNLNMMAKNSGLKNMCVPYPKQEFRGLHLSEGRDKRHADIREWLTASPAPSL